MPASLRQRLALIASLYISQAIPLGFFILAVPAILRAEGLPLEAMGLIGALSLPWLLKFLWAPLVDAGGTSPRGQYRAWLLPLQSLSVLSVLVLATARPGAAMTLFLGAGAVFMLLSATQDIATDGLAVRTFAASERGPANGVQVGGYYLGQILGGGVVLVLYHRLGWAPALMVMAGLLALPLVPVWRHRESAPAARERVAPRVDFGALHRFFARPGAGVWVAVLLLYRTGEAMALIMVTPMLVDRGYSLDRIGLILGILGSLAALAGALAGGLLLQHLGRRPALVGFGLAQSAALALWMVPAAGYDATLVVFGVALVASASGALATTALYTLMMDRSHPSTAATDFTLQQSICAAGPLTGSIVAGFSAAGLGYPAHFLLCAVITLAGAALGGWRLTDRHGAAAPAVAGSAA